MIRGAGIILIILFLNISASSENEGGAAQGAMGGASVAVSSLWCAAGNPAGLVRERVFGAGADYRNNFLLKELNTATLVLSIPAGKGSIGAVVKYYGFSLYNETTAGLSYGMRLSKKFSAGVRLDYLRFAIGEGYGSRNAFSFRIGLLYSPSETFSAGILLANPYPVKLTAEPAEYIRTFIQTGISWKISENLITVAEIEKDLHYPALFKAGMEYRFMKMIFARAGFISSPARFTFGFGVVAGRLQIDLSSGYHPVLGYTPQVSFSYRIKK